MFVVECKGSYHYPSNNYLLFSQFPYPRFPLRPRYAYSCSSLQFLSTHRILMHPEFIAHGRRLANFSTATRACWLWICSLTRHIAREKFLRVINLERSRGSCSSLVIVWGRVGGTYGEFKHVDGTHVPVLNIKISFPWLNSIFYQIMCPLLDIRIISARRVSEW